MTRWRKDERRLVARTRCDGGRRRRGRRGLTLVEVLVSMTLLTIAALALVSFTAVSARTMQRARMISRASILAREEIDSLRSLPIGSLTTATRTSTRAAGSLQLVVTTAVTDSLPNLKQVEVSVVDPRNYLEAQRFRTAIYTGGGI